MRCDCGLCVGARRRELDTEEWVDWLAHRDDYALHADTEGGMYFDVVNPPTEVYTISHALADTEPVLLERSGIEIVDIHHLIETTRTEILEKTATPFTARTVHPAAVERLRV